MSVSMSENSGGVVTQALLHGVGAGVAGGLAFGLAMIDLGLLESIALLVRIESTVVGFLLHMVVAAVIGAGFGLFVWFQRPALGELLYWGLVYGAGWWFLGALTLLPLLSGEPLAWDVPSARALLPALIGHLFYGVVAGLVIGGLRRRAGAGPGLRLPDLGRGAVAGLVGGGLLGWALGSQDTAPAISAAMDESSSVVGWLVTLAAGLLAGVGYAALEPESRGGLGPALVKGTAYGLLWWIGLALTAWPVISGDGLLWGIDDVRAGFATFPGYLLFLGAVLAATYHLLTKAQRGLLSDDVSARSDEGVGTQGLRAIGRGILAGLVGGLVFTVVMAQIGFLSTVAGLIGLESRAVGLVVHLIVAMTIGTAYGLLFIRRSNDLGSALGWGVAYGVVWWLLGPLTLLPVLTGEPPQWTVAAATAAYPALIGHLLYGASLGAVFFRLEARHDPWWISRSEAESARIARASEQIRSSAPGLWALTVLLALTIPVLLGGN